MSQLHRWADRVLLAGYDGPHPPEWVRRRLAEGLGGVVLYHGNVIDDEQVAKATAALTTENAAAVVAIDEEGGDVTRLEIDRGSSWPGNLALGVVDDPDLTRAVAAQVARSLSVVGIGLNLAPTADVNVDPDNPVIGVRSFGDRPGHVAAHTRAWVEGLQSGGVAACAKHFPGHGDTDVDSHHGLPVVADDLEALADTALPPFRAAIRAGVQAVMTAHVTFSAIDDVPATLSRRILTGLLRDQLGFDGVVVTDSMEMAAIAERGGIVEGSVRALVAGADALCLGALQGEARVAAVRTAIVQAVRAGDLAEERLAGAAARVEALAAWVVAHRPGSPAAPDRAIGLVAARRALLMGGRVRLSSPPVVLELADHPTPAIGETGWGLGRWLAEALPGTSTHRFARSPIDAIVGALPVDGRPVVVAVRGRHQHRWIHDAVGAIVALRPETVVVEMGLPDPRHDQAEHEIRTHGASAASAIAAAEVLSGVGHPRRPGP